MSSLLVESRVLVAVVFTKRGSQSLDTSVGGVDISGVGCSISGGRVADGSGGGISGVGCSIAGGGVADGSGVGCSKSGGGVVDGSGGGGSLLYSIDLGRKKLSATTTAAEIIIRSNMK